MPIKELELELSELDRKRAEILTRIEAESKPWNVRQAEEVVVIANGVVFIGHAHSDDERSVMSASGRTCQAVCDGVRATFAAELLRVERERGFSKQNIERAVGALTTGEQEELYRCTRNASGEKARMSDPSVSRFAEILMTGRERTVGNGA